jgi:hypothetical protein
MATQSSRPHRARVRESGAGMGRFFSPTNLDRYRKLASGAVDDTERHQIMEDLAKEMNSFKREARSTIVAGPRPLGDDIGSGAGDQT